MTRRILEIVSVILLLGAFGMADNGWERFFFGLAILAIVFTSDVAKSSKKGEKNG